MDFGKQGRENIKKLFFFFFFFIFYFLFFIILGWKEKVEDSQLDWKVKQILKNEPHFYCQLFEFQKAEHSVMPNINSDYIRVIRFYIYI